MQWETSYALWDDARAPHRPEVSWRRYLVSTPRIFSEGVN